MSSSISPSAEMAENEESATDQLPNDNPIYALDIGINLYASSSEWPVLRAAVADADSFREFLVNHLKVPTKNIISLRDGEATRQRILDAFKALETNTAATSDPCIIIYYAGHGASSPRPEGWENWTTDSDRIEQLCPSDIGAELNGQVVEGIPDRIICALLNSLAKKTRSNNITLILDCCHSAGINRLDGPRGRISRCISNPPPLTVEANLPLYLSISGESGESADQAEAFGGTRALRIASGFGNAHDHSHILLAACGKEQSAYELDDGSHGIFTSRLLKFFESGRLEEVTYETLMDHLDMPPWQSAHCMGAHCDRPLFNRQGNCSNTAFVPCYRKMDDGEPTYTLSAGELQGIEKGQQFSIHAKIPPDGENSSPSSIGEMEVVFLGPTSSTLKFLPNSPTPRVPRVFYAHSLASAKEDPSAIYCRDRKLLDAIFPPGESRDEMKYTEDPTLAALTLTVEGDQVHIDQKDPALVGYIPTPFACKPDRSETRWLQNIIRSWRHFNYHLHRRPRNSSDDVFPQVRMELHYLEEVKDNYYSLEYQPVGENLLAQEPACVEVSDIDDDSDSESASLLGMTLYNDGPDALYPYLFYFDPNDLTIIPWIVPAKGVLGRGPVDKPLLPNSKLTLGYGNGGATPWEFVFVDNRDKDIGFFKLFLSTSPANFACLTRRKSPFEAESGHRQGEMDKIAKEAAELKKELDRSSQVWGVKMATVIQVRPRK